MPPPRNNRWLWFFLALFVLAIAAPTILYFYNRGQQLTFEILAANRKLWQENGPHSYRLTYSFIRGVGLEPDYYVVVVRNGKAVSATCNGRPEDVSKPERLEYYGMARLFDDIERFMKHDTGPKQPRALHRAQFDSATGQLRFYLRSVRATGQRQVIEVETLQATD